LDDRTDFFGRNGLRFVAAASSNGKSSEHCEVYRSRLNDEELIQGNPSTTRSIRKENVIALRRFRDGISVRGENLHTIHLTSELDQLEDLAQRLEAWVPHEAVRIQAKGSIRQSANSLIVLNFILMGAAFFIQNPVVAIPCCVCEIVLLASSLYWLLRGFVERNIKDRFVSLATLVSALLLYRAYSLWQRL
jgi:hypothetical protein